MDEQQKFRQRLTEVGTFAGQKHNILTEQEIRQFFCAFDLTAKQWEMVYSYLETQNIRIAGRAETSQFILMPEEKAASTEDLPEETEDDILSIYLRELEHIPPAAPGEEDALFERILHGDPSAAERLTELYLYNVIAIAREYGKGNVPVGDLIQEGNLGLLTGLSMLPEKPDDISPADYLISSIRESMELSILDQNDQTTLGKRVEEKVNNLNKSILELTEDLGRKITKEELSAYLDIPLAEIEEAKRLAGDDLNIE